MQPWLFPLTFAYLDPGTGSYAFQLLMAGVFGGMFALRQSWVDIRAWAAHWSSRTEMTSRSSDAAPSRQHAEVIVEPH